MLLSKKNKFSKRKGFQILFFLIINILFSQITIAQNSGDFRSATIAGDWQTSSSWETYNGTSWVAAISYPGQNAGSYDVTILSGDTIYIRNDFTSSTMGDVIVNGRLNVGWTKNLQITLNTPLLYLNGGDLGFLHQKTELYLPANSVIQIDNGGDIIGRCSNNTEIYIGGELTAVCRGGGGTVLTFGEVVAGGGTINSIITTPSTSPYVSCGGQDINLLGMFGGAATGVNYEWTVSDPNSVDVVITNSTGTLANNSATTTATSFTPSVNGNYLVSLSVTDGSYTNIESKTVTVSSGTAPTITSTTPGSFLGTGTATLGATASAGTINWYSSSTGGSSLGTGTSFTTPTISSTTTYYVDATNTGCTSSPRTAVVASSYCTSSGYENYNDGITNVSFNIINNDSDTNNSGYSDFTSISTDVTQGVSYNLSARINTDGNYTFYTYAWIDWNQNGVFENSERFDLGNRRNTSNGSTGNSPTITIPANALLGNTRMRVTTRYNQYPTSCDNGFFGEVEDYTINVQSAAPQPEINIVGNGNNILDGNTVPSSTDNTDFGTALVTSGSVAHTFTIQNLGSVNLTLNSPNPYVIITGDTTEFILTSNPTTPVSASGSTTFTITFDPTSAGTKNAMISISNNDSNESTYNFNITGEGTVPVCSSTVITLPYTQDFESGLNGWNSGGADAIYSNNATWAYSNNYSLQIRDNSSVSSSFCSPVMSLNTYDKVDFKFFFSAYSMENNDDFFIEYSSDDGSTWSIINTFKAGDISSKSGDFESTTSTIFYSKTSTIFKTNYTFPVANEARFRVRCDAGDDNDIIYIDNISITGTTFSTPTKAPGGITSDLDLWLKADKVDGVTIAADGSNISKWVDNGKGNNAEVVVAGQEPVYRNSAARNMNFNPVIDFENNSATAGLDMTYLSARDELSGTGGFNSTDMFVVIMPDPTITDSMIPLDTFTSSDPTGGGNTYSEDVTGFGYGGFTKRVSGEYFTYCLGTTSGDTAPFPGYARADVSGSRNYNQISIINIKQNATNDDVVINLNANQVGNLTNDKPDFTQVNNTRYWLGRSQLWNGSFDGRIAEVITYSSTKDDADLTTERNRIQSYLGIKYGITLGVNGTSQDYVDSDGTVIWNQSVNDGFNFDIAGIGRDDASELNQKQSKSVNDVSDGTGPTQGILTIGLTDIYLTNSENVSTNSANILANKQFLVWGNNGIDLNFAAATIDVNMSEGITPALNTDVHFTGMQRVWKVKENGGDIPKVKISIPKSAVRNISPPGSYLMFISDTGVFTPTSDYRIMIETGGDLYTDYDFDGTKFITFGYAPATVVERSIYFNGSVDYIDMEDALDLNASEFTISSWIKRESGSLNKSILSKRNASYTEGYDFKINNSGQVEMSWGNSGAQKITSSTIIPEDEWHQVSVIYDSGTAKIYIDGILDSTKNSLSNPSSNSQSFFIAAAGKNAPEAHFKGNIDEVRIWKSALSIDQLRYVMNQEIEDNGNFVNGMIVPKAITKNEIDNVPWSDLAGYYPMSVYTYTNTNDASGNDIQGALRNLNTVDRQTAPLPYKTKADGIWNSTGTWLNGDVQTIPNSLSIVDNTTPIDWNIVETEHNLSSGDRDITILGLKNKSEKITIADAVFTSPVENNDGQSLRVTHYLEIDGVIDLVGESQLLQDEGSVLDQDSGGFIDKDQQGTANGFNYNYWSSSVGAINSSAGVKTSRGIGVTSINDNFVLRSNVMDGSATANPVGLDFNAVYTYADGAPTNPRKISTYWLYKFYGKADDYNSWLSIDENTTLLPGEGYTMKGTSGSVTVGTEQNYKYRGKPNNGTIILELDKSVEDKNRLIGNPYPSAMDSREFILDNLSGRHSSGNNIFNGAIYFWDHFGPINSHYLSDYVGGYATRNLTAGAPAISNDIRINNTGAVGTKTPGQYIPVNQAFLVTTEIDNALTGIATVSGGDITFKNSQRVFVREGSGNSVFMKNAKSKNSEANRTQVDNRSKIRLMFDSPMGYHRQIVIGLDDNASNGFDFGYDAPIVDINKEDMYWSLNDSKFVIQGVNSFSIDQEFLIGLKIETAGIARIKVDELENMDSNTELFIKDNLTGEIDNISIDPFEIHLEPGEHKDRFSLIFMGQKSLDVDDAVLNNGISVFMNNNISELQIRNNINAEIESVKVFNILGQTIKSWNKSLTGTELSLPINSFTGVYIVKISTKKGKLSKKIIFE